MDAAKVALVRGVQDDLVRGDVNALVGKGTEEVEWLDNSDPETACSRTVTGRSVRRRFLWQANSGNGDTAFCSTGVSDDGQYGGSLWLLASPRQSQRPYLRKPLGDVLQHS